MKKIISLILCLFLSLCLCSCNLTYKYFDLDLRAKYEITVLAIKTGKTINVTPVPDEELKAGSILVIIGQNTRISEITSENKN